MSMSRLINTRQAGASRPIEHSHRKSGDSVNDKVNIITIPFAIDLSVLARHPPRLGAVEATYQFPLCRVRLFRSL
jgi:hypothetical protein